MTGYGKLIKQTVIAISIGLIVGWSGGFAVKAVPVHAFDVTITVAPGSEVIEVVPVDPDFTPVVVTVPVDPGEPVELVTPGGDITIVIEAGTVGSPGELRFESLPDGVIPDLPPGFVLTGTNFDLSLTGGILQAAGSTSLAKPVTITINLTEVNITRSQEDGLVLVIMHYHDGEWTVLETTVDFENRTAHAQVGSFSTFSVAFGGELVEVDKDDASNPINFGTVFPGEAVPDQFIVELTTAAKNAMDGGTALTATAEYQITLTASPTPPKKALVICDPPVTDPVLVTCLTITSNEGESDTTTCATLNEGTPDISDTWTVTLHVADDTAEDDYEGTITVSADHTGDLC